MMRRWKTWIGILISLIAIVYATRGVEWDMAIEALRTADYWILGSVFLIAPIFNIGIRAIRWQILLRPSARVSLASCASATAIGLLANNVLPARIGEFVRAYAMGKRENVPTGTAFGSLFVERMFDGFTVVGILYLLTWLHDFPDWVSTIARVAFYVFAGFLVFQLFLVIHPRGVVSVFRMISRRVAGGRFEEVVERVLVTFIDGFELLKRPWLVAITIVLSVFQWSAFTIMYMLGLAAFGIAEIGWTGAFFTNCVASLGVAVPSSPGFVGTYQAFIVKSLEVFNVDRTTAFSYSAGFHAANYLGVTIVGFGYFFREGLSWGELERSEEELEHDLEEEFETVIEPELEAGRESDDRG